LDFDRRDMTLMMRSFFGYPNPIRILAGLLLAFLAAVAPAANLEQETLTRLGQLRAIETEGDSKNNRGQATVSAKQQTIPSLPAD
jgi:hypothetical protein